MSVYASRQSEAIESREVLEEAFERVKRAYGDGGVPRPEWWGGYRVIPDEFEFWQGRASRLHDRLRYVKGADGAWRRERPRAVRNPSPSPKVQFPMRYLVTARVKRGQRDALRSAIEDGSLGEGSVAGDEYLRDMSQARELADGRVKWVETCFCATPLQEERLYWEEFFDFETIKDAHARSKCRDENGTEPWACCNCDCTRRLEDWLRRRGKVFEP